jgi:mono/diheme cytochrome c family protein
MTLDQGWSPAAWNSFYTTSQGSQLMPATWFAALQRADGGGAFAADRLARYGYLPNGPAALPIGFVVDGPSQQIGMTCAACHTGAIRYQGRTWRIDGGRAHADFQAFLTDLTASMQATLQPDRLAAFTQAVIGPGATTQAKAQLAADFRAKANEFATFMGHSLPSQPWGRGRLDAFGMIFNRVTALDLGVPGNYSPADAPVRYPFLWNAAFQDATQWDGAAPNGDYVKGLARNTGEVFGVFGAFRPKRRGLVVLFGDNSVAFANVHALEQAIVTLKPPPWPAELPRADAALVTPGAALYQANCASCHGKQASQSVPGSWLTPVCRVGTDPLMAERSKAMAESGLLAGLPQIEAGGLLAARAKKLDILATSVIGSLAADAGVDTGLARAVRADILDRLDQNRPGVVNGPAWPLPAECVTAGPKAPPRPNPDVATPAGAQATVVAETARLYQLPTANGPTPDDAAYEARVLNGIWAVAPYLHNGSVPTLRQLLTPPSERAKTFPTGLVEFDPDAVGIAALPGLPADFDTRLPGNSNAGHEYGTTLSADDKRALLAYLRTL